MYLHFGFLLLISLILFPSHLLMAVVIPVGESIQSYIDSHPQENLFELEKGNYSGNILIDRSLELRGQKDSVIHSSGVGTTIKVTAQGTFLHSFSVDGSGGRYDQKDAAISITADKVRVEDILVTGATFGIVVELAQGVELTGNTIRGNPDIPFGLRGDGIRIWEVTSSLIMSNELIDSRDMVVWYASSNRFKYNRVVGGRYGVHFMYSHYNQLSHNQFVSNIVGSFLMYSRHLTATHNLFAATSGPSGFGMGIKESGNLMVISNVFVDNTVGIYSDNSPYDSREENVFTHNFITFSDFAIEFHGQPLRNTFRDNTMKRNRIQVRVSGQATAEDISWLGNHFDDYRGYDIDNDGIGDLPYEYRYLINDLSDKFPDLMFFNGTTVYYLINLLGEALPLMKPRIIMVDPKPRMKAYPIPVIQ